ncbi:MalY/PatB family protein [Photobacterium indicum]|uniref:cysteine-S-conjugate beta-lyase n=1 Tax=Photobacterium indicum TaxID=81447 RepID=A0A2T3LB22_9GAMM|nr:PatB family C-S lyase [Photobacterium indicum]PSV48535.1 aspartate aminotransferase [Photobacterium indicum]
MSATISNALFDSHVDRKQTNSIKWDKYENEDILPMWIADSDFRVPKEITEALQEHINHGVFGYGKPPARLTELLVERMKTLYNWDIQPEWIVFLPGLVCGLNLAVRSLTEAHQSVITPRPIYPPFVSSIKLAQRTASYAPVTLQDKRWLIDFTQVETAPESKLLLFCNPLNPGGTVYRRNELEQILTFTEKNDLYVCSDEIHCDLILDTDVKHIPFASLNKSAEQRSVTLIAPSKTFNIAGLGASMAIIPNSALRNKFNKVRAGIVPDVNVLAYTAAQAAYESGQPWLEQQLAYLRQNRGTLTAAINCMPYLTIQHIEATYLAWIDASALPVTSPFKFFEQAGVGLSPGADFGDPKFVRLNFSCTHETLVEALRRMSVAIATLEKDTIESFHK